MNPEEAFHAAFWTLLAGVLLMRIYFALLVRRAGERLLPDRQAVERDPHKRACEKNLAQSGEVA